ncbi:tryptophan synthase subunit alpha [Streptomyces sp. NPDC058372]|uniref:tryptophan synthase subunit alpha n=1 Tax=unclassified Streptomyces TaxID=2593676 RepID=UPI003663EC30
MSHSSATDLPSAPLAESRRTTLGVFLPSGLPGVHRYVEALAPALPGREGFFEIGIPHAEAVYDGPLIRAVYRQALRDGATMADVLRTVEHAAVRAPVVVMSYWAPVLLHGPERTAQALAEAGASGAMIVDLPDEAAADWHDTAARAGLTAPRFAAADLPESGLRQLALLASGWLYAPASAAPTGYRGPLDLYGLEAAVRRLRAVTPLPVVAGVGISTPALAAAVSPVVDGIVVGSPVLRALAADPGEAPALVERFARAVCAEEQPVMPVRRRGRGAGAGNDAGPGREQRLLERLTGGAHLGPQPPDEDAGQQGDGDLGEEAASPVVGGVRGLFARCGRTWWQVRRDRSHGVRRRSPALLRRRPR